MKINLFKHRSSFDYVLLQQKYVDYLKILSDNDLALRIMAELKEKSSGDEAFEIGYLRLNAEAMLNLVKKIIGRLNRLSDNKYEDLNKIYNNLKENILSIIAKRLEIPADRLIWSYDEISSEKMNSVGGKNAQIGELKNKLGLPVPDGFAITGYAYKVFLEYNNLEGEIEKLLSTLDVNDFETTVKISSQIQTLIHNSSLPDTLTEEIKRHCKRLTDKYGDNISFAVRSSAVGEGTEFSFAGQYTTVLNVDVRNIFDAYKDVVASRFGPKVLFYLTNKGFRHDDVAMSVGCMMMVKARSSGVIYTVDPFSENGDKNIIINSIWGLGKYIVDGDIAPDLFIVSKLNKQVVESKVAHKSRMLVISQSNEIQEQSVAEKYVDQASITMEQIKELVDFAVKIEQHYKNPQIIEWAYDEQGKPFILQTGTLGVFKRYLPEIKVDTNVHRLLINNAETASPGVGYGTAFFVDTNEDITKFPNGGVAVIKHSSPRFVSIMNRAKAIIAEIGSPTGHMATLAREFQIPTIVNAKDATLYIKNGSMVSVDADHGRVYEGYVEELFKLPYLKKGVFKNTPALAMLNSLLEYVTPLNLIDPDASTFSIDSIRTIHDIIRFAHQASMNEMFLIAQHISVDDTYALRLKTDTGFEVYIIDLGGGLKKGGSITEASILSIPFIAFWNGIKKKGFSPKPVNKDGFISVVMNTMANPVLQERLYEKNLALISDEYMNFNIRMGYHISTIEGLCTNEPNDNYIRFIFQGGGADFRRRLKRAQMIKMILEKYNFYVKQTDDIVRAICTKCERKRFEEIMEMLGRLTVYTKQLDMLMPDDRIVLERYVQNFMNGNMEI
ncbi:MAG: PEP/pyruvate-binding domain-containing protein [bacterium]